MTMRERFPWLSVSLKRMPDALVGGIVAVFLLLLARTLDHLLALLLHLLRSAASHAGRKTGTRGNGLWGRFLFILRILSLIGSGSVRIYRCCACSDSGGEEQLARRTLAQIANHENVITGPFEELREHYAGLTGSVCPKDPLICSESFNSCAGDRSHIVQNLLQAGVCGINAQSMTVPCYGRFARLIVNRPVGKLRLGRLGGLRRGCIGCSLVGQFLCGFLLSRFFSGRFAAQGAVRGLGSGGGNNFAGRNRSGCWTCVCGNVRTRSLSGLCRLRGQHLARDGRSHEQSSGP